MQRKMAVTVQELTAAQREAIRMAAEKHGFEIRFLESAAEDSAEARLPEEALLTSRIPRRRRSPRRRSRPT